MKWTVLGFQSPYPGPGGATPGYLLSTQQGEVLIDCGSGVISQLGKYTDPWAVDAVVLSHFHNDHVVDIPILHYALLMAKISKARTEPMPIFAPGQPKDLVDRLLYENYTSVIEISPKEELSIAGASFQFLTTQHDVPCLAMKITYNDKTICYTADAGPETDWGIFVEKVDLLIVEGTFLPQDVPNGKRGHLSVMEAAELATRLKAKKCLITHLYPLYKRADIWDNARAYYTGELHIAEIGLTIGV